MQLFTLVVVLVFLGCCGALRIHTTDELLHGFAREDIKKLQVSTQANEPQLYDHDCEQSGSNWCACGDSLESLRSLLLATTSGTIFRHRQGAQAITPMLQFHRSGAILAQEQVVVEATLDDQKIRHLYAWLLRAFAGDRRYNDLQAAFAAAFGKNAPEFLDQLLAEAVNELPSNSEPTGEIMTLDEREMNSLGAMGAGQWLGRYRTRPHSLLDVRPYASAEEWRKGLKRSGRRSLKRAAEQNFTVTSKVIQGDLPAPHSSFEHFRCIVEHEVRLLSDESSVGSFFGAIQQAIGRYQNCISQTGEIHEYRDENGQLIAFAQEVRKGHVIRGQWFYATDAAAKRYAWFHSVGELARRAIEIDGVEFADLGPSGSEDFEALKMKFGFVLVDDWHLVADYSGAFRYGDEGESQIKNLWQNTKERALR